MIKRILSFFRRPTVVVHTYKVKKSNLEYERMHQQLAAEIGWPWPVVQKRAK